MLGFMASETQTPGQRAAPVLQQPGEGSPTRGDKPSEDLLPATCLATPLQVREECGWAKA